MSARQFVAVVENGRIHTEIADAQGRPSGHWVPTHEVCAQANTAARLADALRDCERLFAEALPRFNWGASALDANAIALLNEVPATVRAALAAAGFPETDKRG